MAKPKRTLIPEGMDKIKDFESLRLFAYPDPKSPLHERTKKMKLRWGYMPARQILAQIVKRDPSLAKLSGTPWTCGYGSTRGVTMDTYWSEEEALVRLDADLDDAQLAVERMVKVDINEFQYAALVSLVFNIGSGNFSTSTLLKRLNEGKYSTAAHHFNDWVKARNQKTGKLEFMQGLQNRRDVEKALFLRGAFVESNNVIPVEVVPDEVKKASKDPGLAAPSVTGVGVAGIAIGEAAAQLEPLAAFSDSIRMIFVGLTVLGVVVTLVLHMKKRKEARKEEAE